MVLSIYYQAGKAPAADFDKLANAIHTKTDDDRLALRAVLKQFFKIKDGRYTNKRVEEELAEKRRRSENASKSAKGRWSK